MKTTLRILIISLFVIACQSSDKQAKTIEKQPSSTKSVRGLPENVIEIITRGMEFQCVDTISSGWNTFKYQNLSHETHFFLLDKYPEGKTIEHTLTYVAPVFAEGMDLINEGKPEAGFQAFGKLPEWFGDIVFSGGSGLIAPKHTAETTLKLEPGYYIMECYVKMPNGKFHTLMGMAKPIIVTSENSGNTPPEPTIDISVSNTEGIVFDSDITKGRHIFSVHYIDQKQHENFMQHDVNLVRLEETADEAALEAWMDWSNPQGLITPVPQGITFLGGVNDMPAGHTGYFYADLVPGKYAFISEVPNTIEKGLFKVFYVKN